MVKLILIMKGGSVDALVPFMGESISDGTLATFLKSKYKLIELHI